MSTATPAQPFTLRAYEPGDCPAMAALFYDTVHTVNAADYTPAQRDAWADGRPDLAAWDASFRAHRTLVAVRDGEIVGFAGLVGAGRTEIIRALYGADKVSGHEVRINGELVRIRSPKQAKRAGLGLVPEDRKRQGLITSFTVQSNITMAALDRLTRFGVVNGASEKDIAQRQIKALAVKTPSAQATVGNLSGGNQQKCIVGRWMELNPKILILDEPTRGIDVGAKYEIYVLMNRIVEEGGAVIMISSELPEVLNMSNRVLTICEGRITGEFNPEQASTSEIMDKAIG